MSPKVRIGLGVFVMLLLACIAAIAQQGTETRLVTVELKNATIEQALESLFKDTGYKYAIQPGIKGTVSANLKDIPFDSALQAVLSAATPPLTYRKTTSGVFIIGASSDTERTVEASAAGEVTAPPVVVKPVEPVPAITPDTTVIKRTPVINGQIDRGEWDKFFEFNYSGIHATTYVDWDSNNLYIASEATAPVDLLITLDANSDGWFHGGDNYELIARHGENNEAPTLSVSRYQSQGATGTGGVPLTAAEASSFTMKAGSAPGSYVYEIAIPRASVTGLALQPGRKIGLKVAVGIDSGTDVQWVPTAPLGEVQAISLVDAKSSANASLEITANMLDKRVAPGEELFARIHIRNKGKVASTADTIVVGGEGKTAKLLGSQLIRIEGIQPGKSCSFTFHTRIPQHAEPGSAALGIEARSGDESVAASIFSFDVMPPFEVQIDTNRPQNPLDGYYKVAVLIKNNRQQPVTGKVKLTLPEGWTFRKSEDVKEFYLTTEEGEQSILFRIVPPKNVDPQIKLVAEVMVDKASVTKSGTLNLK